MQNQIDYKNGANSAPMKMWNRNYCIGQAGPMDWNFSLKKNGSLTGWISYTFRRSEIKIDGINHDDWYPARQDQTNNIALVGIYQL